MKYSSRNSHIIAFVQQIRWPILVYPFHQSVCQKSICECVSWSKCVHLRMSAFEDVCVVRFKQNTKRIATRSITSGSINMIPTHTKADFGTNNFPISCHSRLSNTVFEKWSMDAADSIRDRIPCLEVELVPKEV